VNRYAIRYGTKNFETGTIEESNFPWITKAHDMEHAIERFHDSDPEAGWVPTEIAKIPVGRENLTHTWNWVRL
jgi:hypothetical protein